MAPEFISYAYRDLSDKRIKKYANQYDGIDMTKFLGCDENSLPFLVQGFDEQYDLMIWNGVMGFIDEGPVRSYATVQFLLNNESCPVFDSIEAAEMYASEHGWPQKR